MIYTVSTVSNAGQSVELMMENNIFKQLRRTARDKGDNGWLSAHQFIKIWNHYDTDGKISVFTLHVYHATVNGNTDRHV